MRIALSGEGRGEYVGYRYVVASAYSGEVGPPLRGGPHPSPPYVVWPVVISGSIFSGGTTVSFAGSKPLATGSNV